MSIIEAISDNFKENVKDNTAIDFSSPQHAPDEPHFLVCTLIKYI